MTTLRKLPARFPRVETGVIQFGGDWPGIFIRGDNAAGDAQQLRMIARGVTTIIEPGGWLNSFATFLESCDVKNLPDDWAVPIDDPRPVWRPIAEAPDDDAYVVWWGPRGPTFDLTADCTHWYALPMLEPDQ